jgi:hypothetical protein
MAISSTRYLPVIPFPAAGCSLLLSRPPSHLSIGLMSLDYTWFSTMWGVYIFAGSAWASMASDDHVGRLAA